MEANFHNLDKDAVLLLLLAIIGEKLGHHNQFAGRDMNYRITKYEPGLAPAR